jgi:hypothetical protein
MPNMQLMMVLILLHTQAMKGEVVVAPEEEAYRAKHEPKKGKGGGGRKRGRDGDGGGGPAVSGFTTGTRASLPLHMMGPQGSTFR